MPDQLQPTPGQVAYRPSIREYVDLDERDTVLACVCDLVNSWCRESGITECRSPYTLALRDAVDRLWAKWSSTVNETQRSNDALRAALERLTPCLESAVKLEAALIDSGQTYNYVKDQARLNITNWSAALQQAREVLDGTAERTGPEVVCLCGSTRFYDAFQEANYRETMAGRIVLSVGFYPHSSTTAGHGEGVGHDSAEKVALDELHKRKIDLCDYVLVLNCGGYVGSSTRSEIEYAERHGKPVRYLEPLPAPTVQEAGL